MLRRRVAALAAASLLWSLTLPDAAALAQVAATASAAASAAAPTQRTGSAAGLSHRLGAGDTEAVGGTRARPKQTVVKAATQGHAQLSNRDEVTKPWAGPTRGARAAGTAPGGSGGFDPKRSTEIVAKRTATTSTYQNPDGTFTLLDYTKPVHYQQTDGSWADIDTSLAPGAGGRLAARSTPAHTEIGATAQDPALESYVLDAAHRVDFGLSGAARVPALVSGATATYAGVFPQTDLTVAAGASSLKEGIVLRAPSAASTWTFPIHAVGLTPRLQADGSVGFFDEKGAERLVVPAGSMTDSAHDPKTGTGATSYQVTYTLVRVPGGTALRVTADRAWLDDPVRVYPITVDPSLNVPSSSSTYVDNYTGTNHSGNSLLLIGNDGSGHDFNSFIAFSGLYNQLKNEYVTGAALNLYLVYSKSSATVTVSPITSSWNVNTISSYPGPSLGGAIGSFGLSGSGWGWIGLTPNFIDGCTHSQSPYSCGVGLTAETSDSNGYKEFASDGGGSANPPYLQVNYEPYAAYYSTANGAQINPAVTNTQSGQIPVTVTNHGTDTWTYSSAYKLGYHLYNSAGTEITPANAARTPIAGSVAPNSSLTMLGTLGAQPPGNYSACWDMVDPNGKWFSTDSGIAPGGCFSFTVYDVPAVLDRVSPGSGYVFSTLTPTLAVTAHDPDDWPNAPLQYQFHFSTPEVSGYVATGWSSSKTYTVPANDLKWGDTLLWWAEVDESGLTTNSQSQTITNTVQIPQPAVVSHLGGGGATTHGADPFTGDYTTTATDAVVPTTGPALQIQRTYNSLDPRVQTMFGEGWSTAYDAAATIDPTNGNVQVTYPNGQSVLFGRDTDGSFTPPPGRQAVLVKNGDGTYSLTDKDGTVFAFTAQGVLTTVTDADQRSITLARGTNGLLQTVTSNVSHRALHFTWTTVSGAQYPHVTSVATDPLTAGYPTSALTWTYNYTGDDLTQVCPPTSATACTKYGYNPGSHYRAEVLDANPASYLRLADSVINGYSLTDDALQGPTTGISTAANTAATTDHAIAADSDNALAFNGTSSDLHVNPGDVANSPFATIELWFKTTTAGGVLYGYEPWGLGGPVSGHREFPALYIGTDGKLHGGFYNGATNGASMSGGAAVTDGAWHHAVVTGDTTGQRLILDGTVIGTMGAAVAAPDATQAFVGAGWIQPAYPASPSTEEPWYFKGEISQFAYYPYALTPAQAASHNTIGRHSSNLLKSITLPSGKAYAAITYDTGTDRVSQLTDENGGIWKLDGGSFGFATANYQDQVLASHPIDYYRLNEASGSVAHSSVHTDLRSRDGTYYNVTLGSSSTWAGQPALGDTPAGFNGTSSYVQLPDNELPAQGPLVIELGFEAVGPGVLLSTQNKLITDPQAPTGFAPLLYIGADGLLHAQIPGAGNYPLTGVAADDGNWHDAILSIPGNAVGDATLYQDGTEVAQSYEPNSSNTAYQYTYVGAGYTDSTVPSAPTNNHGYIDAGIGEVSIYGAGASYEPEARWNAANDGQTLQTTVTVTDPANNKLTYSYDTHNGGRVIATTDQLGGVTGYTYDDHGFLASVSDPDGHSTTYVNDNRGNPTYTTTCRSPQSCQTSSATYYADQNNTPANSVDPRNDLRLTTTDANNGTTTYGYDAVGNLASTTTPATNDFPSGRTTTSVYTSTTTAAYGGGTTPAGLLASTTTARGETTSYRYFSDGDVAQVVNPAGLVTTFGYDALGRETSKVDTWPGGPAAGSGEYTSYDGQNRVIETSDSPTTDAVTGQSHQLVTNTFFDVDGDVTGTTQYDNGGGDAGGDPSRSTSATYDAHDHLATQTDAAGDVTKYTAYDLFGNITSMTDPAGNVYTATYGPTGKHQSTTLAGYIGDPANPSPPTNLVVASYAYDPAGRLGTMTDAMGRVLHYRYFDDNLLAQVTEDGFHNADGTTRTVDLADYVYDGAGNLVSETDSGGKNQTTYTYDVAGRLDETSNVDGTVTDYTYDADGNQTRVAKHDVSVTSPTSSNSSVTDYTYDPLGNELSETTYGGSIGTLSAKTTWTRDSRGLPLTKVDPRGNVSGANAAAYTTSFTYDEQQRLTVTAMPPVSVESNGSAPTTVNPTTRNGYDTYGDLVEAQDALGHNAVTSFDALGRPVEQDRTAYFPPGSMTGEVPATKTTYTPLGKVNTATDPLGNVTSYTYDQFGNVATRTDPQVTGASAAGVWHYTYDADGEQLTQTDPTGAKTSATYDDLGRQISSTQYERNPAASFTWTTGYDDAGNQTSITDPLSNTATAAYDAGNRRTSITDAAQQTTTTTYNYLDEPLLVTAPDKTAQQSTYGLDGKLATQSSLDATGAVIGSTSYGYDLTGNETSVTDPDNATWTRSYDALNHLVQQVEPVSSGKTITTTFGYDAAGQQTRFTDGRGNVFLTTYNSWDLPESGIEPATTAYPNAADRTYTTTYDLDGRPTVVTEPGGVSHTTNYDQLGRVTGETGTGAEAATAAHSFTYDLAGRTLTTAAQGGTNTYTYDDRGLLTNTSGPSGTSVFTYNNAGLMASRQDGGRTAAAYTYDQDQRLKTLTDPVTGVQETLGYDTVGDLNSVAYGTGGATRALGYDGMHRVTSDTLKTPSGAVEASMTYGYDPASRLKSKTTTGTAGAAANTYGYDQAGRLTSWTSGSTTTAYGYDDSGNRTQAGTLTASYDARDRLLNAGSTTYTYTARGTRATQTTGTQTTSSTYDAFDRLITDGTTTNAYDGLDRLVSTGATQITYSGLSNDVASATTTAGTSVFSRTPDGSVVGVAQGGTNTLALTDRHTDVVGTFTATGTALTTSTAYDPFGAVLASSGTSPALGYQSGWTDAATGDVNMAARWYDPATGVFTSRDTSGQGGTPSLAANRYAYAAQDPLDNTDPSGHCFIVCAIVGAVVGAVVGAATYTVDWASDPNAQWSWSAFGESTGKDALTGAIIGGTAGFGLAGAVVGGAVAGDTGYGIDCMAEGSCSAGGFAMAGGVGAASGLVGYGGGKLLGYGVNAVRGAFSDGVDSATQDGIDQLTQDGIDTAASDSGASAADTAAEDAANQSAQDAAAAADQAAAAAAEEAAAQAAAKAAEEAAARQAWLNSPAGRAFQAASNEGPDVAAAQTRHALDSAVPAASLPAEVTPTLADNLSQAAHTVADNPAPVVSAAENSGTTAAGSTVDDAANGTTSGALGNASDPVAAGPAGGDAASADNPVDVFRSAPKGGRPRYYPSGPIVSLSRFRMAMGRAGLIDDLDKYELKYDPEYTTADGRQAYGNSPTKMNQQTLRESPVLGDSGRPLIRFANLGLQSMEQAVRTFYHEVYHQELMAAIGDHGTEEDAEQYGLDMWNKLKAKFKN